MSRVWNCARCRYYDRGACRRSFSVPFYAKSHEPASKTERIPIADARTNESLCGQAGREFQDKGWFRAKSAAFSAGFNVWALVTMGDESVIRLLVFLGGVLDIYSLYQTFKFMNDRPLLIKN